MTPALTSMPMKDSGMGWVGAIPSHWDVRPFYSFAGEVDSPNTGLKERNLLSLSYGQLVRKDMDRLEGLTPASFEGYNIIEANDIVFRLTDLQNDQRSLRSARAQERGIITSAYVTVRPQASPRFFEYLMRSYDTSKVFYGIGGGIRQSMKFADLKRLPVVVPPTSEMEAISSYLDRATARIDTLVAKKTRFIELLREKRQALITHAVTKGLDASVPTKDSGVEWLGEVPSHWSIPAIKHLVSTPITDGPHETPVKQDAGVRFISAEAISGGRVDFSKAWGFISVEDDARFSRKYRPAVNDIYMIKSGATTGVVAIVEDDVDFNIWSPLAAIRPNLKVVPKFLLFALRSSEFQAGVALNWSYGTQQNIGMKVLEQLPAPIPPLVEQEAIVAHLDRATTRIDTLIAKTERSIELLREHRTALITAAVTGKIDLRNAA